MELFQYSFKCLRILWSTLVVVLKIWVNVSLISFTALKEIRPMIISFRLIKSHWNNLIFTISLKDIGQTTETADNRKLELLIFRHHLVDHNSKSIPNSFYLLKTNFFSLVQKRLQTAQHSMAAQRWLRNAKNQL